MSAMTSELIFFILLVEMILIDLMPYDETSHALFDKYLLFF